MKRLLRSACGFRVVMLRRVAFALLAAAMLLARMVLAQPAGADAAMSLGDAACVSDPQKAARAGLDAAAALPLGMATGETDASSFASPGVTASAAGMTDGARVTKAGRGAKASGPGLMYRRQSMRFDASLGRAWAMVEVCGHPERPLRAMAVTLPREAALAMHLPGAGFDRRTVAGDGGSGFSGGAIVAMIEPPLVRAGDTVRLWQSGGAVEMELAAKAEQPGRAGDAIWLRSDAGGFTQRMRGVVRSRGSVEMLP